MSDIKDSKVVSEGRVEIDRYLRAEEHLRQAKSAQNSAECEMANAENSLGKWLCPADAANGESFCVWHCGHLIQAQRLDPHTFKITIRQRARL